MNNEAKGGLRNEESHSHFFVGIIIGCTTAHKHGEFTQHYKDSMFEISENEMFSVELVLKEHGLTTGVNTVDLVIHDSNDRNIERWCKVCRLKSFYIRLFVV